MSSIRKDIDAAHARLAQEPAGEMTLEKRIAQRIKEAEDKGLSEKAFCVALGLGTSEYFHTNHCGSNPDAFNAVYNCPPFLITRTWEYVRTGEARRSVHTHIRVLYEGELVLYHADAFHKGIQVFVPNAWEGSLEALYQSALPGAQQLRSEQADRVRQYVAAIESERAEAKAREVKRKWGL